MLYFIEKEITTYIYLQNACYCIIIILWGLLKGCKRQKMYQYLLPMWLVGEGIVLNLQLRIWVSCDSEQADLCDRPELDEQVRLRFLYMTKFTLSVILNVMDFKCLFYCHCPIYLVASLIALSFEDFS